MLVYIMIGLLIVLVLVLSGMLWHFLMSKRRIRLTDYDISVNGGREITEHKSRMDAATNKFVQLEDEYEKTVIEPVSYRKKHNKDHTLAQENAEPIFQNSLEDDFDESTVMLNANLAGDFAGNDEKFTNSVQEAVTISLKDLSNGRVFVKPLIHEVVIGRSENVAAPNYISLSYDKSISKEHCKISKEGEYFYLEDLGSLNHTYVRNREVTQRECIQSGEMITIGQSQVLFTVER